MRHRAEPEEPDAPGLTEGEVPPPRSARVRIGVGAVVVLLLAGLVVAVVLAALGQQGSTVSYGAAPDGAASNGAASPGASGASAGASAPAAGAELLVHVTGAVRTPGIVSLHAGARVLDAVAAAGGFTEEADPAGVNLARPIADGEQLAVPKVGEAPAANTGGGGGGAVAGGAVAGGGGGAGGGGTGVVDLNTATLADLDTLPRIGPALAQRILDWREAHGRFSSVEDLREVTGIGDKIFADLKDRVRV